LSVLLLGAWALIEKNPYSEIGPRLTKFYLDPAWMLLIVGACIFVIGFSGCIGALRENTCFLSFVSECGGEIAAHTVQYAILLGILLLLQMTISILFFVAKEWAMNEVHRELDSMIVHYRDDPDLQSVIDWIQNWVCAACSCVRPHCIAVALLWHARTGRLGHEYLLQQVITSNW
jgi:tetraspanin-5